VPRRKKFPRSIERGPVEASDIAAIEKRIAAFPRSIERGPVEAEKIKEKTTNKLTFPRSIERGPVEATNYFFRLKNAHEVSALN